MHKVIDLHCDSVDYLVSGKDLRNRVEGIHVDLPRMRKGGVALQVFAAYVPPETPPENAFAYTGKKLDAIDAFARSDERLAPVETAADLRAVMAGEKTGVMAAVENGLAIGGSLENLEKLRRRKVRIMTLVHSRHLPWIASCTGSGSFRPEPPAGRESRASGKKDAAGGLSSFGGRVLDAMHDLGIIPDLSHASEAAFWDVIRRGGKPVIASHSCAYGLCKAARNLKDDQLKALGDSGGLVGVNFYSLFLSEPFRLDFASNVSSTKNSGPVQVPQSLIADHIDYMVSIAGEDCVAIGSDFDGMSALPSGVTGSDFFPVLEAELRFRGYSESRIEKIFNANFLRLLEEWE